MKHQQRETRSGGSSIRSTLLVQAHQLGKSQFWSSPAQPSPPSLLSKPFGSPAAGSPAESAAHTSPRSEHTSIGAGEGKPPASTASSPQPSVSSHQSLAFSLQPIVWMHPLLVRVGRFVLLVLVKIIQCDTRATAGARVGVTQRECNSDSTRHRARVAALCDIITAFIGSSGHSAAAQMHLVSLHTVTVILFVGILSFDTRKGL